MHCAARAYEKVYINIVLPMPLLFAVLAVNVMYELSHETTKGGNGCVPLPRVGNPGDV